MSSPTGMTVYAPNNRALMLFLGVSVLLHGWLLFYWIPKAKDRADSVSVTKPVLRLLPPPVEPSPPETVESDTLPTPVVDSGPPPPTVLVDVTDGERPPEPAPMPAAQPPTRVVMQPEPKPEEAGPSELASSLMSQLSKYNPDRELALPKEESTQRPRVLGQFAGTSDVWKASGPDLGEPTRFAPYWIEDNFQRKLNAPFRKITKVWVWRLAPNTTVACAWVAIVFVCSF